MSIILFAHRIINENKLFLYKTSTDALFFLYNRKMTKNEMDGLLMNEYQEREEHVNNIIPNEIVHKF